MHPLEVYYLNQAGRGLPPAIGPVYSAPLLLQLILWSGAKAVGRETLRTGGKILTDIAEHRSPK